VLATCGGFFNVEKRQKEIAQLEAGMSMPGFWDNQNQARASINKVNTLKRPVELLEAFNRKLEDVNMLIELVDESDGEETALYEKEIEEGTEALQAEIERLEIQAFLSGPMDGSNAIVTVHAGAGGTESCDWCEMLFRMYCRWVERSQFKLEVLDIQEGDEAGLSRATFRVEGESAYGFMKAERGVHRLVRISPFDANKKRHTSFCSVDVIAEIEDEIEVDIRDEDLRVDTYRSSGKGGQHVNKTDSAVRLTHLPTGIVVACQSERSQIKNKATAMKTLKARIYEKMQDDKRSEMEKFYGEKGEIGWGNQIRSYVFQPYQMVKDLRTGMETSNVDGVMDGDIDRFIQAWLRAGCPSSRNKEIKIEE
jgi:peptide chain release factor 2